MVRRSPDLAEGVGIIVVAIDDPFDETPTLDEEDTGDQPAMPAGRSGEADGRIIGLTEGPSACLTSVLPRLQP